MPEIAKDESLVVRRILDEPEVTCSGWNDKDDDDWNDDWGDCVYGDWDNGPDCDDWDKSW